MQAGEEITNAINSLIETKLREYSVPARAADDRAHQPSGLRLQSAEDRLWHVEKALKDVKISHEKDRGNLMKAVGQNYIAIEEVMKSQREMKKTQDEMKKTQDELLRAINTLTQMISDGPASKRRIQQEHQ